MNRKFARTLAGLALALIATTVGGASAASAATVHPQGCGGSYANGAGEIVPCRS